MKNSEELAQLRRKLIDEKIEIEGKIRDLKDRIEEIKKFKIEISKDKDSSSAYDAFPINKELFVAYFCEKYGRSPSRFQRLNEKIIEDYYSKYDITHLKKFEQQLTVLESQLKGNNEEYIELLP